MSVEKVFAIFTSCERRRANGESDVINDAAALSQSVESKMANNAQVAIKWSSRSSGSTIAMSQSAYIVGLECWLLCEQGQGHTIASCSFLFLFFDLICLWLWCRNVLSRASTSFSLSLSLPLPPPAPADQRAKCEYMGHEESIIHLYPLFVQEMTSLNRLHGHRRRPSESARCDFFSSVSGSLAR